jgi:diguanylate cyclase (GGDEF)-like protein
MAMGVFAISSGLVVTVLVEWRLASGLQQAARDHLQHIAGDVARALGNDLHARRQEVDRLAVVVGSADVAHSRSAQHVFDGLKSQQPAYAWIGLTDAKGKVIAASDGLLAGVDVSARPWFSGGREQGFFGEPHEAKLLAKHLQSADAQEPPRFFDIASPVRAPSGAWDGVLGAHLYTDWIQKVVENAIASRIEDYPLDVYVADHSGAWLYTPTNAMGISLESLRNSVQDKRYLMAFEQVPIASGGVWTVVVREEGRDAFAPVYENRRQMLIITPLAALLLALGTWVIAGRVVQPLQRLADTARQHVATTGHLLDEAVSGGKDEAELLGQTLNRLALRDPLTDLANRSAVKHRLGQLQAMQAKAPDALAYAVLFLNLDDFHLINNARGREMGDQILRAFSARLRALIGSVNLAARLGGDEFVLVLEALHGSAAQTRQQAQAVGNKVLEAFKAPIELQGVAFRCPVSIGIAVVSHANISPDMALAHAELAMQEAKSLGKRQLAFFDEQLHDRLKAQAKFEQELHEAIPAQLRVLYQPQVDWNRQIVGAELLLRWGHPQLGLVSPAQFIPVAEKTGLIVRIGHWVLEQACLQIKAWQDDPQRNHLVLAVNVSATEFSHPDYVATVQQSLLATGANPARLKLELTESVFAMDVAAVAERMQTLKALGVSFSLDDFGTGFSSLSYLNRLPIDQLKIDQSFVQQMLLDESSAAIVRTVVALGNSLGLQVIAEGVETEAQFTLLAQLGCFMYQGYLFGKPAPVEEFPV